MTIAPYRRVWANPLARGALVLGVLMRVPLFAGGVLLTIHVVTTLGRGYAEAGVAAFGATAGVAIAGPWRGRLLDRMGLRRVVLPSLAVLTACWSVAPFVGYLPLLGLVVAAGLFTIPSFSIIRQAIIAAVPHHDRRTALALDSVAVELAFMIGPLVGVWAATRWPTSWVLCVIELSGVLAGVVLWLANPPLRAALASAEGTSADRAEAMAPDLQDQALPRGEWFSAGVLAVCLAACATTLVLTGSDISIVAGMRELGHGGQLGVVLAVWGLGSAAGGLVYGGLSRALPSHLLLLGLGLVTFPLAWAQDVTTMALLAFVAGVFCAPTITATVDELSALVPERARGEALGWHASFMTGGSAAGAPLAGLALDAWGARGGFSAMALVGVAVAVTAALARARRRPDTLNRTGHVRVRGQRRWPRLGVPHK